MALGKLGSSFAGLGMLAAASAPTFAEDKAPTVEGLDQTTVELIVADYRACVVENLEASDWDESGSIDPGDEEEFLLEMNEECDETFGLDIKSAHLDQDIDQQQKDIAALDASMANSNTNIAKSRAKAAEADQSIARSRVQAAEAETSIARSDKDMAALTDQVIAGIKKEMGLN
jgi:hypothetical protein